MNGRVKMDDAELHILEWIGKISKTRSELGGLPVCPFAKKARYKVEHLVDLNINPVLGSLELIVYILDNKYTFEQLDTIAKEYNSFRPSLVFLPDGIDRYSNINGVQTSNGKYNILLCQDRAGLQKGRDTLQNTSYYSFWDKDYLKEILEQ